MRANKPNFEPGEVMTLDIIPGLDCFGPFYCDLNVFLVKKISCPAILLVKSKPA